MKNNKGDGCLHPLFVHRFKKALSTLDSAFAICLYASASKASN